MTPPHDHPQLDGVVEIAGAELEPRLAAGTVVVDIREPDELAAGVIPGSHHIPMGRLLDDVGSVVPEPSTDIVLYCQHGVRSAVAARALGASGYEHVTSLAGGFEMWAHDGRPATTATVAAPVDRYARHMVLPGVGPEGQQRLGAARVLVVGAGGLGSPAALYLAAAGVGTVGIVDHDAVELSNLQRQILHSERSVGGSKVVSAVAALAGLNGDIEVVGHEVELTATTILEVLSGYDVIVDGSDNFPTRYLLNDASLHARVPVVHGSVFRYEGQVSVFTPFQGPCYRCLFPLPPPPELAPDCSVAGVLGVLPGVIGAMQALEAIKLLVGVGEPLVGRLLTYDGLGQQTTTLNVPRDPGCPACADPGALPPLVDYDAACRPAGAGSAVDDPR